MIMAYEGSGLEREVESVLIEAVQLLRVGTYYILPRRPELGRNVWKNYTV